MKIARVHLRVVQLLIATIIFLNYDEVESLSKKEDEELERQLKHLNKPAIKTIKTEYGDIYDCVNFYQQPAFDHPLLKNHAYHPQMKPSFSVTKRNNIESSTSNSSPRIGLKDEGCPMGTVPIRRTTKEDLIRERRPNRFNASYVDQGISYSALAQTTYDTNNKFSGAKMISSIYNPNIVLPNQWSSSFVEVESEPDQIQAGWRVDPTLYGDNRTRFFSSFKASTTQCFNTRCPGFIIVYPEVPLDQVFSPTSGPDGTFVNTFSIEKNVESGEWWLFYTSDLRPVGFWPPELFTGLKDFAARASWGGEVFSSGPTFPPMGSGSTIDPGRVDSAKDAFCREISILDSTGNYGKVVDDLLIHNDAPTLYTVFNIPNTSPEFGHAVFFGGPGTN